MATVHDVELMDVLVDAGESAKDLDRPGMVRILEMVQSRAVGMVIVAKLDRLTRSVKDLAVLLEQFRKEKHHRRLRSISLSELKQFTYWLFMYRVRYNDKARVASDTKKALDWLNRSGYPDRFIITRPLVGNRR